MSEYRFGFNGKEDDQEYGNQFIQDYGFRLYNPSIAKFLSFDPLAPNYPWNSPYAFAEGDVIRSIDLDGLEKDIVSDKLTGTGNVMIVIGSDEELERMSTAIKNVGILKGKNTNWDYILTDDVSKAEELLKGYGDIANLHYRSHAGQESEGSTRFSLQMTAEGSDSKMASREWVKYYNTNGTSSKDPGNKAMAMKIESFSNILKKISAGGNAIFAGCQLGKSEGLCNAIASLGKSDVNYYFNADYTAQTRSIFRSGNAIKYYKGRDKNFVNQEVFNRTFNSGDSEYINSIGGKTMYNYGFFKLVDKKLEPVVDKNGYGLSIKLLSEGDKAWDFVHPDEIVKHKYYQERELKSFKIQPKQP
ncbi:MAG: hypothetical protein MK212_04135 [Saprospiraceae bacterium]|nr:hypothetical protein [Saprospiraceae bacterium]